MAFSLLRFPEFVFGQDVLIEFEIGPAKIPKEGFDVLFVFHHFVTHIVGIDVDADRTDHTVVFPNNWYGRALKLSRPDVQFIVKFVFVLDLSALQIDEQACRAVSQMTASDIVFERNERMRRVGEVVQQNLDARIRE